MSLLLLYTVPAQKLYHFINRLSLPKKIGVGRNSRHTCCSCSTTTLFPRKWLLTLYLKPCWVLGRISILRRTGRWSDTKQSLLISYFNMCESSYSPFWGSNNIDQDVWVCRCRLVSKYPMRTAVRSMKSSHRPRGGWLDVQKPTSLVPLPFRL